MELVQMSNAPTVIRDFSIILGKSGFNAAENVEDGAMRSVQGARVNELSIASFVHNILHVIFEE